MAQKMGKSRFEDFGVTGTIFWAITYEVFTSRVFVSLDALSGVNIVSKNDYHFLSTSLTNRLIEEAWSLESAEEICIGVEI